MTIHPLPSADDLARVRAEFVARFPGCRGVRHLDELLREKRTAQLREEVAEVECEAAVIDALAEMLTHDARM